jgi:hypothetical protein
MWIKHLRDYMDILVRFNVQHPFFLFKKNDSIHSCWKNKKLLPKKNIWVKKNYFFFFKTEPIPLHKGSKQNKKL